jgi:hypothetical protein
MQFSWSNGTPNANQNTYIYEPYVTSTDGLSLKILLYPIMAH